MCHLFLRDARFWSFLLAIDTDLAQELLKGGCPRCRAVLHSARYPRKPRGGPDDLPAEYRYRLSFCCASEGCRRRATPPSVRFLGRKVYLAVIVVLVSAMRQGPSPRGLVVLNRHFGADRRTIARWRSFWSGVFPASAFWRVARARVSGAVDEGSLPRSLIDSFRAHAATFGDALLRLLQFLSPISVPGGLQLRTS